MQNPSTRGTPGGTTKPMFLYHVTFYFTDDPKRAHYTRVCPAESAEHAAFQIRYGMNMDSFCMPYLIDVVCKDG